MTVAPLFTVVPEVVVHCTMNTEVTESGGVEVLPFVPPMPSKAPPCLKIVQPVVIVLDQMSVVGLPAGAVLGVARNVAVGTGTAGCCVC